MGADLIIKMFGSVVANATTNDIAAVDIPQDAVIENIDLSIQPTGMDALDDVVQLELSFASANAFATNDSRISIAQIGATQQFLTSGGGVGMLSKFLSGLEIPVAGGERIHLHCAASAGVQGDAIAYLYLRTRGSAPARRSVRRR